LISSDAESWPSLEQSFSPQLQHSIINCFSFKNQADSSVHSYAITGRSGHTTLLEAVKMLSMDGAISVVNIV